MKVWFNILLIFFSSNLFSQAKVNFEDYFVKDGGAQLIHAFNETVDIDIPNSKANFSKSQASVVVGTFFKKQPATSYKANHRGGGNGRAHYEIGVLLSGKLKYRTYLLYEMSKDIVQIIELRIEPED